MTKLALKFVLATALSTQLASVSWAKPQVPTVEQLAAYPNMSGFNVSNDGKHMVALEGRGEDRVILIWDLSDLKKTPTVLGSKDMKIQSAQFVKDDLLAVTMWQPFDFNFEGLQKDFLHKLYIVDLKGENWREPLPRRMTRTDIEQRLQAMSSPRVLDTLPNDPDHILVIDDVGVNSGDIVKVNLRNQRTERIQRSEERASGYLTDYTGEVRARTIADVATDGSAYISTQIRKKGATNWDEHFRSYVKDRDVQQVVGFTEDPNIALILSNAGQDKSIIYEYDVNARKRGETLFQHKYFNADHVVSYRYPTNAVARQGQILALSYDGPRGNDVTWVSPVFREVDKAIRQHLNLESQPTTLMDPATGASVNTKIDSDLGYDIVDYTPDLKTIVFVVSGSNRPPLYYIIHNGSIQLLNNAYPQIDPNALGKTDLVYYKARDGQVIPAYLTKPNTALCGVGPWPTVIHPHGGPWARDHGGFDGSMWVPLLSSRCRAVLQPQYRGSADWSKKLWLAGDREWGGKMQDDKDDGAKWLIDQKIAIPGRIAMFGFSYGGYASMAAAIRPNGLYKCAIAGAGVSDIRKIWARYYTNSFFNQAQGPTVKGLSPIDKADQIQIPIMVYHGERDQIVPIRQSEWFVEKAKKAGKDVVYHDIPDYAHGPAWTRQIMANQLKYIDDYLANGCGGGGL